MPTNGPDTVSSPDGVRPVAIVQHCLGAITRYVAPGVSDKHDPPCGTSGAGLARGLLGHTGGLLHAVNRRDRVRLGAVAPAGRYAEEQVGPPVRRIPGFVG